MEYTNSKSASWYRGPRHLSNVLRNNDSILGSVDEAFSYRAGVQLTDPELRSWLCKLSCLCTVSDRANKGPEVFLEETTSLL